MQGIPQGAIPNIQLLLLCQDNAAATDSLVSEYYAFNKILFDWLKVCYKIFPNQK